MMCAAWILYGNQKYHCHLPEDHAGVHTCEINDFAMSWSQR